MSVWVYRLITQPASFNSHVTNSSRYFHTVGSMSIRCMCKVKIQLLKQETRFLKQYSFRDLWTFLFTGRLLRKGMRGGWVTVPAAKACDHLLLNGRTALLKLEFLAHLDRTRGKPQPFIGEGQWSGWSRELPCPVAVKEPLSALLLEWEI